MSARQSLGWAVVLGVIGALAVSSVDAQQVGRTVVKRGVIGEDLYVAGGRVDVLADVAGDVVAAGGQTVIGQRVTGDVAAAGGNVTIRAEVADDVRVIGGLVMIGGRIGGDVVAAGGSVSLDPEVVVAGHGRLAGGEVEIRGSIGKALTVAAGRISLFGAVDGDVELAAGEIEILPTARIGGNLIYRSPQAARIDPAAQIGGTVTHHRIEVSEARRTLGAIAQIGRIAFFLGLMVAGIVLYVVFPDWTVAAARTIGNHPWRSLGVGLALLVLVPVAGVFLTLTIVGIPLGLALWAVYFLSLLIGFLIGAVFLGEVGAVLLGRELSAGERILSIVLAWIVLGLVRWIPVVGILILLVAVLFGLGALSIHSYRMYASAR